MSSARPVLISDVSVFDGRDLHPRVSVLVRDGVIAEIAERPVAGPECDRVDGPGSTLLPGLIDAHTHTFSRADLRQALLFGVTTELDMFSSPERSAELKRLAVSDAGMADLRSSGTGVTAPGGHPTDLVEAGFLPPFATLGPEDSADAFVAARLDEGSDHIKIIIDDGAWLGMDLPTLSDQQVRQVVLAAHERGKQAIAHASTHIETERALDAGVDGLAHVFVDRVPPERFGARVARERAFVIPTLRVWEAKFGHPREIGLSRDWRLRPRLPPEMLEILGKTWSESFGPAEPDWPGPRYAREATSQLHEAGVPVLAGSDVAHPLSAHGLSMHAELAALVDAGLSPRQALTAATAAPAECFGLEDRGAIEVGRRGDLVLVRGDPTARIDAAADIAGIWRGGVPVHRVPHDM